MGQSVNKNQMSILKAVEVEKIESVHLLEAKYCFRHHPRMIRML